MLTVIRWIFALSTLCIEYPLKAIAFVGYIIIKFILALFRPITRRINFKSSFATNWDYIPISRKVFKAYC